MKFQRSNLNPHNVDDKLIIRKVSRYEVPKVEEDVFDEPLDDEVVGTDIQPEEVVEEVVVPEEEVETELPPKTEPEAEESLEDKYAIPIFEPTIGVKKTRDGVSFFSREASTPLEAKPIEVKAEAADVTHIEGVSEIPDGAEVVDGVELVGDLVPEVEAELVELTSVCEDEIPTQPSTLGEEPTSKEDDCVGEREKPISSDDAKDAFSDVWDKFVDNVIVPTLITCLDKVVDSTKDYVLNVVAPDLKKNNPDVK